MRRLHSAGKLTSMDGLVNSLASIQLPQSTTSGGESDALRAAGKLITADDGDPTTELKVADEAFLFAWQQIVSPPTKPVTPSTVTASNGVDYSEKDVLLPQGGEDGRRPDEGALVHFSLFDTNDFRTETPPPSPLPIKGTGDNGSLRRPLKSAPFVTASNVTPVNVTSASVTPANIAPVNVKTDHDRTSLLDSLPTNAVPVDPDFTPDQSREAKVMAKAAEGSLPTTSTYPSATVNPKPPNSGLTAPTVARTRQGLVTEGQALTPSDFDTDAVTEDSLPTRLSPETQVLSSRLGAGRGLDSSRTGTSPVALDLALFDERKGASRRFLPAFSSESPAAGALPLTNRMPLGASAQPAAFGTMPNKQPLKVLPAVGGDSANELFSSDPSFAGDQPQPEFSTSPESLSLSPQPAARVDSGALATSLSDASFTSQPLTTQVLTALAQRLSSVVEQTADTLTLRLDPPELGEIEVQFQRLDNGITIRVTAKESVTMEMLMSRGAEIERLLRNQNPDVQRFEFDTRESTGDSSFGQTGGQSSQGGAEGRNDGSMAMSAEPDDESGRGQENNLRKPVVGRIKVRA